MKILLSIKPKFVKAIFSGQKKYEFRKQIFKRNDVNKIVVYSSSPECRIVGEIEIDSILCDKPDVIWNLTKNSAGISKMFFDEYFKNKEQAYAIKIKTIEKYERPLKINEIYPNVNPPQSFCYVEE